MINKAFICYVHMLCDIKDFAFHNARGYYSNEVKNSLNLR